MADDPEVDYDEYLVEFAALIEAAWLEFKAEMDAGENDPITREVWLTDAEIDTDDRQTGWVSEPMSYADFREEWHDARREVWRYV